jgi:FlaA1/EpsC-like NDP-sugar epimerase
LFVLDMGEPIRIVDLARDLIELSGLEVGRDVDIVYTGLRPGEKLFEEISLPGEEYVPTQHDKIFVSANDSSGANLPRAGIASDRLADLEGVVEGLVALARRGDEAQVRARLREIVPEYAPPSQRQQG